MAIATRKKKSSRNTRTPKFMDEKYTGPEPAWDGSESWSAEKYYRERCRIGFYYNYFYTSKEGKPWVLDWMKKNGYKKEEISAVRAVPDSYIGIGYAGLCKALNRGMPPTHPNLTEYLETLAGVSNTSMGDAIEVIKKYLVGVIAHGKSIASEKQEEEEVKKKSYRPSIQELLRDKAVEMSAEIEDFIGGFDYKTSTLKEFDPLKILRKEQAKANHTRYIKIFYKGEYEEILELLNPPKRMNDAKKEDYEQLKEGYSHLKKAQIKSIHDLYKSILDACEMIENEGKAQRKPRIKKAPSKEKVVSKVKYQLSDENTKSVSLRPVELLDAQAVMVYNTKTRKLGIYVAEENQSMTFKGTTLIGFDEKKSVQKTLRKPTEQVPEFKKIAKRSVQKSFDDIKSVETKMNGRFNEQTLILRVF